MDQLAQFLTKPFLSWLDLVNLSLVNTQLRQWLRGTELDWRDFEPAISLSQHAAEILQLGYWRLRQLRFDEEFLSADKLLVVAQHPIKQVHISISGAMAELSRFESGFYHLQVLEVQDWEQNWKHGRKEGPFDVKKLACRDSLVHFSCNWRIEDLSPFSQFPALTRLDLLHSETTVSDLAPLVHCPPPKLQHVSLRLDGDLFELGDHLRQFPPLLSSLRLLRTPEADGEIDVHLPRSLTELSVGRLHQFYFVGIDAGVTDNLTTLSVEALAQEDGELLESWRCPSLRELELRLKHPPPNIGLFEAPLLTQLTIMAPAWEDLAQSTILQTLRQPDSVSPRYPVLTRLDLTGRWLTSLDGVEGCPTLELLTVRNAPNLADVRAVGNCKQLTTLNLHNSANTNQLLEQLACTETLTSLTLSSESVDSSDIIDIALLSGFSCLTQLKVEGGFKLLNFRSLGQCKLLRFLELDCAVESLDGVGECSSLKTINVSCGEDLTDVSSLLACASLKSVWFIGCPNIANIEALEQRKDLLVLVD